MAHKLTGQNLEYVALRVQEIKKAPLDKRGMYVKVYDSSDGEQVKNRLVQAYAAKDYYKGIGWRDFTVTFPYVWQRDEAVRDVNAAVDEYMSASYNTNPPAPDTPPADPDKPDTDKPDYTTYIIIGVLAAIIIALLLWRRR